LTIFLSAVAAVSLLVGGIGIMNIMLVSVTERTREIGIAGDRRTRARRADAVPGRGGDDVGAGRTVGIAIGLGASAIATHYLKIPYVPSAGIVLIAFVFSAGIGIAFGYLPARRAARLDPIEALRHE
jgi:putative ABC transport system permease protein